MLQHSPGRANCVLAKRSSFRCLTRLVARKRCVRCIFFNTSHMKENDRFRDKLHQIGCISIRPSSLKPVPPVYYTHTNKFISSPRLYLPSYCIYAEVSSCALFPSTVLAHGTTFAARLADNRRACLHPVHTGSTTWYQVQVF